MAVEAQTTHILRTQQQLPARHIGRMNFMFKMGDRGNPILDRKRHGFLGRMIACRTSVTNFTTRAIFKDLSLIHISEPTRLGMISYAVFCLKKKKKSQNKQHSATY